MNLHNLSASVFVGTAIPAPAAAGTPTAEVAAVMQPFDEGRANLVEAWFTPIANVTGTDTNSRTLNVKLPDGTIVATLAFTAGVNGVKGVRRAFTLAGTAAQRILAIGGAVTIESALVGTGLALPAGRVDLGFEAY